tara:strand:+ start:250 stop:486 length:237 start_codon:yes stop_codon:yes gene_type:complete
MMKDPKEDADKKSLEARIAYLESEILKRDEKKIKPYRVISRIGRCIRSIFSRQNLELILSLISLAISISVAAVYLLNR